MPHEVADLEPVLLMLSKQDINDLQVIRLISIFKATLARKYECIFGMSLKISRKYNVYYDILNQVLIIVTCSCFACWFQSWQTRYVLLLWLSIIIMIPFEMSRLDGASDGSVTDDKTTSVTQRIIEFGKVALSHAFKPVNRNISVCKSWISFVHVTLDCYKYSVHNLFT